MMLLPTFSIVCLHAQLILVSTGVTTKRVIAFKSVLNSTRNVKKKTDLENTILSVSTKSKSDPFGV